MKKNISIIIGIIFFSTICVAQVRTVEKRVTTDSKGQKDSTESVIISRTEDITPLQNILVINPLKFFLFYNLSYFRKVNESIAIGGGIQLPTLKGISGFGLNGELRFYPSGKALRGFYFAPNVSYNNMSTNGSSSKVDVYSIGGLVGWQWFPGTEFAMGLGIGIDHYFVSNSKNSFSSYDGNVPAVRFDIGYAW